MTDPGEMTLPDMSVAPRTLYKYCPPERIDILSDLQVRFSPPCEFNDTFDSYHLIPAGSGVDVMAEREKLLYRLGILCKEPHRLRRWVRRPCFVL